MNSPSGINVNGASINNDDSGRNAAGRYFERVQELLQRIHRTQMESLEQAGSLVADIVERDGLVYALGTGHSLTVAAELYYRAGGLACFDIIHDKTFGRAERLSGYAEVLLESYPINSRDGIIITSNSGRNALPIEMAIEAKRREISTIAITSLAHSRSVESRHESGRRLCELCDIVIDNCGVPGDAIIEIQGADGLRVAPTSTLAGVFIVNCISAIATADLLRRGIPPPVFVSMNVDGGEMHNERLVEIMKTRLRGL